MLYLIFTYFLSAIAIPSIMLSFRFITWILRIPPSRPTLWEINAKFLIKVLLGTSQITTRDGELIKNGFILCNHRSLFDLPYDSYMMEASSVGRINSILLSNLAGILFFLYERAITIIRGRTNRNQFMLNALKQNLKEGEGNKRLLWSKHTTTRRGRTKKKQLRQKALKQMDKPGNFNKRVLFYPEGTRMNYKYLHSKEHILLYLKPGFLKSIYDYETLPVQLYISANKDYPMNLKKMSTKYGVPIISHLSSPIYPSNFNTFDEFFTEVGRVWYTSWVKTHSHEKCIDRI